MSARKYRIISKVMGSLELDGGITLSYLGHTDVDVITDQMRWLLGQRQIEIRTINV